MRLLITLFSIVLISACQEDNTSIFSGFDFEEDKIIIYGIENPDASGFFKSEIQHFKIDNKQLFELLKKEWIYLPRESHAKCNYNYKMYVLSNNMVKRVFTINLKCKEMVYEKEHYHLVTHPLLTNKTKLKKVDGYTVKTTHKKTIISLYNKFQQTNQCFIPDSIQQQDNKYFINVYDLDKRSIERIIAEKHLNAEIQ